MAEINYESISLEMITHAGEAKSLSFEAIDLANEGKFAEARKKIEDAEVAFNEAHKTHFIAVQKEAEGTQLTFSLLLVHAEDQLMTTQMMIEMAKKFIDVYEKIK